MAPLPLPAALPAALLAALPRPEVPMRCTCTRDHVCPRCEDRAGMPPGGVTDEEAADRAADRDERAFWDRGEET